MVSAVVGIFSTNNTCESNSPNFKIYSNIMVNVLTINKIDKYFHTWRVADARVVGGKNTHNGMGRLLLKSNTNKGTNNQGTEYNNFNVLLNTRLDITEMMVGHKTTPIKAEVDYEKINEDVAKDKVFETVILKNKVLNALEYSRKTAQRLSSFKKGNDFERNILIDLTRASSPVRTALTALIPDFAERTILYQAQFCINNALPYPDYVACKDEGQFFIADFACIKPLLDGLGKIIGYDVIILDTKLNSGTDFTNNQKTARNQDGYMLKVMSKNIFGTDFQDNFFNVGVKKILRAKKVDGTNYPFYKIISDNATDPQFNTISN